MENKKTTKILAIIIILAAVILIVVGLVLSLSKKSNKQEEKEYKQCGEVAEGTNYEHTGINYYIDKDNNRINNSELILNKHDSIGEEDKIGKLSLTDMKIKSPNCEERAAMLNATLTNNSDEDLEKIMIIIDVKDKEGNYTHKFSITIPQIAAGGDYEIEFKTLGRIIDMYDYEFTYIDSSQMVG